MVCVETLAMGPGRSAGSGLAAHGAKGWAGKARSKKQELEVGPGADGLEVGVGPQVGQLAVAVGDRVAQGGHRPVGLGPRLGRWKRCHETGRSYVEGLAIRISPRLSFWPGLMVNSLRISGPVWPRTYMV